MRQGSTPGIYNLMRNTWCLISNYFFQLPLILLSLGLFLSSWMEANLWISSLLLVVVGPKATPLPHVQSPKLLWVITLIDSRLMHLLDCVKGFKWPSSHNPHEEDTQQHLTTVGYGTGCLEQLNLLMYSSLCSYMLCFWCYCLVV